MHTSLRYLGVLATCTAIASTGCSDDDDGKTPTPPGTIVQVAAANPQFSSLVAAVTKAELVDTLSGPGPFTVFAPTNDAFAALLTQLNTSLDALTKDALAPILTYHVVAGEVKAQQVTTLKGAKTVNGADIRIRAQAGKVFLTAGNGNDIEVTTTDIQASNGVIHVINKVMLPPGNIPAVATANSNLSTLVAALSKANLVEALKAPGPFTVFAPTNAAFTALLASKPEWKSLDDIPAATLEAVLKYHVVVGQKAYSETVVTLPKVATLNGKDVAISAAGGAVKLNGDSNVVAADVLASNGVVHVIDKVLLPPSDMPNPAPAEKNIVEIAQANPNFSSLVAAVTKADLAGTLSGPGPFTVFAPTNEAFAELLKALATTLDALTKEALAPILTYHVVSGEVKAAQVAALKVATTVNGADIRIRAEAGKVFLSAGNGSDIQVTTTDIDASNGVIHVIDKVMLPPKNIAGVAASNPNFSILVQALTKADLVGALSGAGPFTVFAPTNAAFMALLESNPAWNSLDDIDAETLKAVLQYHVVPGKVYSETVVTLTEAQTLLPNKKIAIAVTGGMVKLNTDTTVTATDVLASNGVIHVIDKVLRSPN